MTRPVFVSAEEVCGDLISGIRDEELDAAQAVFRRIVR